MSEFEPMSKKEKGPIGAVVAAVESVAETATKMPEAPVSKPKQEATAPKTKKIEPEGENVMYEASASPIKVKESKATDLKSLHKQLEEEAKIRFSKSFNELPIDQKLAILNEQIADTGDQGKVLREQVLRLQVLLRDKEASPEQWEEVKKIFAEIPKTFEITSGDRTVIEGVRAAVFNHVSSTDKIDFYGLNNPDDIALDLSFTMSGQRARRPGGGGGGRGGGRGRPPPGTPPIEQWDYLRGGEDPLKRYEEDKKRIIEQLTPDQIRVKIREERNHIRSLLSTLEQIREERGWHLEGITPEERSLATALRNIKLLTETERLPDNDPLKHMFEKADLEERVRSWLHRTDYIARRGASPIDMDIFVKQVQELDDADLLDTLIQLPGVWKGFQLLEQHGMDIMAHENNPERLRAIMEQIEEGIEAYWQRGGIDSEGIDKKTALLLARRFWKVTGREGLFYRRFMVEKDMVHYGDRPVDDYLSDKANITWDLYRILYYPHAIWKFFEIGGTHDMGVLMEKQIRVRQALNIFSEPKPKTETVEVGTGVGRDVRKVLIEDGFDLHITDLFSRRLEAYFFPVWLSTRLDRAFINTIPDPARRRDARHEAAYLKWYTEQRISKIRDPDKRDEIMQNKKAITERLKREFLDEKNIRKSGEFIISLENTPAETFKFAAIRREHEAVRSNVRDHKSAMGVLSVVWDFIANPTPANYFKIAGATQYTTLGNAQEGIYGPCYDGLVKVNRGRLPLGVGIDVKVANWNSIARQVLGWENLEEWDLRKIRREAIMTQHLSKNQVEAIEGPYRRLMWLMDHGIDPFLLSIILAGLIQAEIEQTAKELKEGEK